MIIMTKQTSNLLNTVVKCDLKCLQSRIRGKKQTQGNYFVVYLKKKKLAVFGSSWTLNTSHSVEWPSSELHGAVRVCNMCVDVGKCIKPKSTDMSDCFQAQSSSPTNSCSTFPTTGCRKWLALNYLWVAFFWGPSLYSSGYHRLKAEKMTNCHTFSTDDGGEHI